MTYQQRERLVSVVAAHEVVGIEAASGFGKSSLAVEAARALDLDLVRVVVPTDADVAAFVDAVRRALGPSGVGALVPPEADGAELLAFWRRLLADPERPPTLVCVDEVQRATGAVADVVRDLAVGWSAPHHLVVCGRRLPTRLAAGARLTETDLAFTVEEFAAVAGRPDWVGHPDAARFVERVDGWPAVLSLVRSLAGPAVGGGDGAAGAVLDEIVTELLERARPDVAELAVQLAQLPWFDPAVADAVAHPDTVRPVWHLVRDLGLPVNDTGAGTFRFSDPVAERLRRRRGLTTETVERATRAYVTAGAAPTAVDLLVATGEPDRAAEVVAGLHLHDLERFQPAQLRALSTLVAPESIAARARLLVQRARLGAVTGAIGQRAALLDEAERLAAEAGDAATVASVTAERVRDLARKAQPDAALDLGRALLAELGADDLRVRASCLAGLGLAEASRPGGDRGRAGADLTEAASLFRRVGAVSEEAGTLHWLAYWVQYMDGRLVEAVGSMRSALGLLAPMNRHRGVLATFLAEMLAATGDPDGALAALDDAYRIGRALGDELTLTYADWVAAEAATVAGDATRTHLYLADLERRRGDWWDHSTGTDILAEVAQMHRRLGDVDAARAGLDRLAGREEGTVATRRFAEAAFEAEHGDAAAGLAALDTLEAERALFAVHRPRAMALAAVAARRCGDGRADELLAQAEAEAARLGLPDLLDRVEPTVMSALRGAVRPRPPRRVRLLGGFSLEVDGVDVPVPAGHGSTLVKALALSDRALTLDEILELLWADEDPGVARRRLRNLLNRLRDDGVDVVVRTADGLMLSPGFVTDVDEFRAAATTAVHHRDAAAAQRALDLYAGELLPADRYLDGFALAREQCARQFLAVADMAAEVAEAGGDTATALDLLDRALAVAPYEEHRAVRAAESALRSGQRERALTYADQAARILAELGLPPPEAVRAVRSAAGSRGANS